MVTTIVWATRPGKEAEITGLWHSPDGINLEGLKGAILDPGTIIFGVSYTNKSSVPLTIGLDFSVDDQQDAWSSIIQPNEELMVSFAFNLSGGSYRATATIYEEETMARLDEKSATFRVEAVTPPPEAIGHIVDILVRIDMVWLPIEGLLFEPGEAIRPGVTWMNDMETERIRGHVDLIMTMPDGSSVDLAATSGQDSVINPGVTQRVAFIATLDGEGVYQLRAVLDGDIVA